MEFPHGVSVVRQRRPLIQDRYNPGRQILGEWDDAVSAVIPGAWIAQTSSVALTTATRTQTLTAKSLFSTDPSCDVRPGDRIVEGDSFLYVTTPGHSDTNPFTGWQPYIEFPLEKTEG